MKFKVGDKVVTPRDGAGTITRISLVVDYPYIPCEQCEVRIDEPNYFTDRWCKSWTLYFRESELREVSNEI